MDSIYRGLVFGFIQLVFVFLCLLVGAFNSFTFKVIIDKMIPLPLFCCFGFEFLFHIHVFIFSSVQFNSVAQSCPTLCDPMNCSTPGLPVHHHLPEFTQTNVHRVRDAIQPSHPQSSPSPPAPNPSLHQSLFQSVSSSHEVAKVLELQL